MLLQNADFRGFNACLKRTLFACVSCMIFVFGGINCAHADETYPFSITTTELSDKNFQFRIFAAGTFYVDCGTGGTLTSDASPSDISGNSNDGFIIDRSNVGASSENRGNVYTCSYSDTNSRTIRFGGQATGYFGDIQVIGFNITAPSLTEGLDTNVKKILTISGSLGQIFGTIENPSIGYSQPKFGRTFSFATNMTGTTESISDPNNSGMNYALPPTLFSGISGDPAVDMFAYTFYGCSGLTGSIPSGLFGNIYGTPAKNMFNSTFRGCSNLTEFGDTSYVPWTFLNAITDNNEIQNQATGMFFGTPLNKPCPADTYDVTREQFSDAEKPWCKPCPPDTHSPVGSTSIDQCVEESIDYPFSLTTTNLSAGDTFTFTISASGEFYVDCGTNGALSGSNGVISGNVTSGWIIDRDDDLHLVPGTYTCTYSAGGEKTIQFGGTATHYGAYAGNNTDEDEVDMLVAAISFSSSCPNITSLYGDLSDIFPIMAQPNNFPRFMDTFEGCNQLVEIPDTLFSQYTKTGQYMFFNTFKNCVGLGTSNDPNVIPVPEGLFSGITSFTGTPQAAFYHTFEGCVNLKTIPEDLFLGIRNNTTGSHYLFAATFKNCTSLTEIPSNLFKFSNNVTEERKYMFYETFKGCSSLTEIPSGLFSIIKMNAEGLFRDTFKDCDGLTSIPDNLFSNLTIAKKHMFAGTFNDCDGLTYLPKNLFSNITYVEEGAFKETFKNCDGLQTNAGATEPSAEHNFIPPELFSGLINADSPDATDLMTDIFADTTLAEECPENYYLYNVPYYRSYWTPKVSCLHCPPDTPRSPAGSTSIDDCASGYSVIYNCGVASGTKWIYEVKYNEGANVELLESPGDNCFPTEQQAFTEWFCTSDGNTITPDENNAFSMPAAHVTCTAQWGCNNANNYWWNADNTECVQGYEITLSIVGPNPTPDSGPVPTTLYTIPTIGAFIDEERQNLMLPKDQNGDGGAHPIISPKKLIVTEYDTNAPINPITNALYVVTNSDTQEQPYIVPNTELDYVYACFLRPGSGSTTNSPCYIYGNADVSKAGYLTPEGYEEAKTIGNKSWRVTGSNSVGADTPNNLSISGYTFSGWYENVEGTGNKITWISSTDMIDKLYAKWTPKHYTVTYNKGAHADENSENYVDAYDSETEQGGATFDAQYTALSFDEAPISEHMSVATGYVFAGWTMDQEPQFENGVLQNEFTGYEYWKRDSNLNVYAAYTCADGYFVDKNGNCVNDRSVTYDCNNGTENQTVSYINGQTVVPDFDCTVPGNNDEYEFAGWYCSYGNGSITLSVANTGDYGVANKVYENFVYWSGMPGSGFSIEQDVDCIAVWQKKQIECPNDGALGEYILNEQKGLALADDYINTALSSYDYGDDYGFTMSFNYGTVYAKSMCSQIQGIPGLSGGSDVLFSSYGDHCWCQVNALFGPSYINFYDDVATWIYLESEDSCNPQICRARCVEEAAKTSKGWLGDNNVSFREILYTHDLCSYRIDYTCDGNSVTADIPVTIGVSNELRTPSSVCNIPTGYVVDENGDDIIGGGWMCTAEHAGSYTNENLGVPDILSNNDGPWTAYDNYICTIQLKCDEANGYRLVDGVCDNNYTVTYTCGSNGGAGTPPSGGAYEYNATVTTPTKVETVGEPGNQHDICYNNSFTNFQGWRCYDTFHSDEGFWVSAGGTFDIRGDTTCKAGWASLKVGVHLYVSKLSDWGDHFIYSWTYKGAHLNNTSADSFMTTDTNPLPDTDIPSRPGWDFSGYYTEDQGSGTQPVGTKLIGANGYITEYGMEYSKWVEYYPGYENSWYAGWVPNSYGIVYHNIEDTDTWTGSHPGTYTVGADTTIGVPSREHYVFAGWCVNDENCENYANNVNGYTISASEYNLVNLYAIWDCDTENGYYSVNGVCVNSYTITYSDDLPDGVTVNGMPDPLTVDVPAGTEDYQLAQLPTATGYNITGWDCGEDAPVTNNTITMPATAITCSVVWGCDTANGYRLVNGVCNNEYTITYSDDLPVGVTVNGMPDPLTEDVPAGTENHELAPLPTATGYDITGWSCKDTNNNTVTVSSNNTITMPATAITCSVVWSCDTDNGYYLENGVCVNDYGITYTSSIPAGVTVNGMPDPLTVEVPAGTEYTLAQLPTATGYNITGWDCGEDAPVSSDNTITMPAMAITCSVVWGCDTANGYRLINGVCNNEYTITYSDDLPDGVTVNGMPDPLTVDVPAGTEDYQLAQLPTATGYNITGWDCGENAPVSSDNTITMPAMAITCSVVWSCDTANGYRWGRNACNNTYIVEYSCGDASGVAPTTNTYAVYGEQFTPANNTCDVPNGAVFNGWNVSGTNDIRNRRFIWNYTEDKIFTAIWDCDSGRGYQWNAAHDACVFVCDTGKWLHIGEERMCLYDYKPSFPALAVQIQEETYYLRMNSENEELKINDHSNKRFKIERDGTIYNVSDVSTRNF